MPRHNRSKRISNDRLPPEVSDEEVEKTFKPKEFKPKNEGQRLYETAIKSKDIVICCGKAGTGKSFIAAHSAVELFKSREVGKIILSRPILETYGDNLGFLPGSVSEKVGNYFAPILNELSYFLSPQELKSMQEKKELQILPIAFMRGTTFKDSCVIIDEASNCNYIQLKMILSRIGKGSKLIINGDADQCDIPNSRKTNDFKNIISRLRNLDFLSIITLTESVRHPIIEKILERLEAPDEVEPPIKDFWKDNNCK